MQMLMVVKYSKALSIQSQKKDGRKRREDDDDSIENRAIWEMGGWEKEKHSLLFAYSFHNTLQQIIKVAKSSDIWMSLRNKEKNWLFHTAHIHMNVRLFISRFHFPCAPSDWYMLHFYSHLQRVYARICYFQFIFWIHTFYLIIANVSG